MFFRLLVILIAVPFIELAILLELSHRLSWSYLLALVVGTGLLGSWLARREGLKAWSRIQSDLAAGTLPGDAIIDGALILVAGVVLVTPGVLTDLLGFLILIAPIRRAIGRRLGEYLKRHVVIMPTTDAESFVDVEPISHAQGSEQGSAELPNGPSSL